MATHTHTKKTHNNNNNNNNNTPLEEEAISEILVADMASESGAKASDIRRLF